MNRNWRKRGQAWLDLARAFLGLLLLCLLLGWVDLPDFLSLFEPTALHDASLQHWFRVCVGDFRLAANLMGIYRFALYVSKAHIALFGL